MPRLSQNSAHGSPETTTTGGRKTFCLLVNPGYFGRTSWLNLFSRRKKGRDRTGQEDTLKQPRKLIFNPETKFLVR